MKANDFKVKLRHPFGWRLLILGKIHCLHMKENINIVFNNLNE
jgi:hypothetical protein